MDEQILTEAAKLMQEGKAVDIEQAIKKAKEIFEGKLGLQKTIEGLKKIESDKAMIHKAANDFNLVAGNEVARDLKVLRNAIAYLENAYEDDREEKDLSKVLFILQQKDKLKTSNFMDKLDEEVFEFKDALMNQDRENQFEEILDIIQIAVTIMAEVIKPTDRELLQAIATHNEKLLVDRQYKTKGTAIKFLFEE